MRQLTFDPYATLGIRRDADARQVRDAYRRLARRHHPDLSDDRQATERMQRINTAWEILSSPARRAHYDADAEAPRAASAGHWAGTPPRTARWAPPPRAWSAGQNGTPGYRTRSASNDDDEGRSWPVTLGLVIVLLVVGPLLFGVLPIPFFGLFVLLAAGWATRRI
jgi:curved DNA-binding protein CbpA